MDLTHHTTTAPRRHTKSFTFVTLLATILFLAGCEILEPPTPPEPTSTILTNPTTNLTLPINALPKGQTSRHFEIQVRLPTYETDVVGTYQTFSPPENESGEGAPTEKADESGIVRHEAAPSPWVFVRFSEGESSVMTAAVSRLSTLSGVADVQLVSPGVVGVRAIGNQEGVVDALEQQPGVESAWVQQPLTPQGWSFDDPQAGSQWGLYATGAAIPASAHPNGFEESVTVAVIDSAFDLDHPDMQGAFLPGIDLCPELVDGSCPLGEGSYDRNPGIEPGEVAVYHGTHVAGTIAATANNGEGAAGIAPHARIVPIKIFHKEEGDDTWYGAPLSQAISWAIGEDVPGLPTNEHPADVINLSLGGQGSVSYIQPILTKAYEQGVVIVAAAGNDASDSISRPASGQHVIAAGALGTSRTGGHGYSFYTRSHFSNTSYNTEFGPGVLDVMAPGSWVTGPLPDGQYGGMSGTSVATSHVAAAAAWVLSQNPTATPDDVLDAIQSNAYFDPDTMTTEGYGSGPLRIEGALGYPSPTSPSESTQPITTTYQGTPRTHTLDLLTGESIVTIPKITPTSPDATYDVRIPSPRGTFQ